MKRVFFLAFALMICLTLPASAHKGRTDENGGHYDHSTGEYHYHHGYPAHQHVNGICPYNFDDKTNHDSGGTSSRSSMASKSERSSKSDSSATKPWFGILKSRTVYVSTNGHKIHLKSDCSGMKHYIKMTYQEACDAGNSHCSKCCVTYVFSFTAILILICIIAIWIIGTRIQTARNEKERIRLFEAEKAHYTAMYAGKPIEIIAAIPQNVEIGTDGLPKEKGCDGWGPLFTYYSTPSGKCFHCMCGCSSATIPVNAVSVVKRGLSPCMHCCPTPIPQLDWYWKYLKIKQIKDRYGIE